MKTGMHVGGLTVKGREYAPSTSLIHGNAHSPSWDYKDGFHPPIVRSNTHRLVSVEEGFARFCAFANPTDALSDNPQGFIYERLRAQSKCQLEERLSMMENAQATLVFATGMAAISGTCLALMDLSRNHSIVRDPMIYGCSHDLFTTNFPSLNIDVQTADMSDIDDVLCKIDANGHKTRILFFETPANPGLKLIDIPALRIIVDELNAERAPEDQILIVVDNTFATPYSQRPLNIGADFVSSSLTKNLNGFGTDMGGYVSFKEAQRFYTLIARVLKNFGGVLSDNAAWDFLVYSLPTFMDRLEKKNNSAMQLARFLENHLKVGDVIYPGLESFSQYELAQRQMSTGLAGRFAAGDMIYFQLAQSQNESDEDLLQKTKLFLNYIARESYAIMLAVSLGTQKSLIECPELMTHSCFTREALENAKLLRAGIRFSVGAEYPGDLENDLGEAFNNI